MGRTIRGIMLSLLFAAAAVYAALLAVLYSQQRNLIFHPDTHIQAPEAYGLSGFESINIPNGEVTLQLWQRAPEAGMPLIVYFHGNASHLGNRAPVFAALAGKGFGVLGLSYRGYGNSTGSPSEEGLLSDARAAMRYASEKLGVAPQQIIIYGESLGTGVAVAMAGEFPVAGLVLQAAYTSVANRAAELYPYVPVRLLLKHRFDSLARISKVRCPLLMFHGELDATIPVAHGRALLAAAAEPKKGVFFADIDHNNFDNALISEHVLAFAKEHAVISR